MDNNEEVKKYVETCREEFWQEVFKHEVDYLVSHLKDSRNVLSVGCGPAAIEGALTEHGFNVTGLDVSREALKCAPDKVRTVACRAEDMEFPASSFDAVIFVASLQFVEDYRKALEKAAQVLRPEGKIILMLLNPQSNFFKEKTAEPDSYVNFIRHKNLQEIEEAAAVYFSISGEYILGIKGDKIFAGNDPSSAALYVINGKRVKRF